MTEQHWNPANFQSSEWIEGVLQEKIQLHLYPFRHSSRILANANRPHMAVSIVHGLMRAKHRESITSMALNIFYTR